jgi:hypothetical protein
MSTFGLPASAFAWLWAGWAGVSLGAMMLAIGVSESAQWGENYIKGKTINMVGGGPGHG